MFTKLLCVSLAISVVVCCNCPGSKSDPKSSDSGAPPAAPPPPGSIRIYGSRDEPAGQRPSQTLGAEYKYSRTYDSGIKVDAHAGAEKNSQSGTSRNAGVEVTIPIGR